MNPRDVFLSHSSDDAESARDLRAVLEGAGYSCWMAPDDIVGTETWTEQILGAIEGSRAMIVLVSKAANASPHVSREVNLALGRKRAVLPIRIEPVAPGGSLEYLLSLVQRVDAFPPPVSNHRDRILRRLASVMERPEAIPPPPPPPLVIPPSPVAAPPDSRAQSTTKPLASRTAWSVAGVAIAALAVLGLGAVVLSGPKPTPDRTLAAGTSQSSVPGTSAPTDPGSSALPSAPTLQADEQRLVNLLPLIGSTPPVCSSWATPPNGEDVLSPSGYAGSLARLTCGGPVAGGPPIRYALYPDSASLDAAYAAITKALGVAEGGACRDAIPANAPWSFEHDPDSGKLACFERQGKVQYVWTQAQLRLLVQWLAPDNAAGFAFWTTWTKTRNANEQALLAALPASADDNGGCNRAADLYYLAATAILDCAVAGSSTPVYYALFPTGDPFPADPMSTTFDSLLTAVKYPDDTASGCLSVPATFGRGPWVFGTNTQTEGYIGCYERTDNGNKTAQIIWTYNRLAIMGLWNAADLASGVSYFKAWTAEAR